MTRLVPRPDWTPVEFVLAVRAAVWEQGVTPETAANRPTVLALFRPAEEPEPTPGIRCGMGQEWDNNSACYRLARWQSVDGKAVACDKHRLPTDVPIQVGPAPAPVAPPQAEERADLPASEESSWAPVLVESRTPETESVMIHHAHRGQACVACELAALRSELSASQREVERLRKEVRMWRTQHGTTEMFPSGENRSEG